MNKIKTFINNISDNTSRLSKMDFIIILIITILYGFLSFYHLGDTKVPLTYHEFNNFGDSIILKLKEKTNVGRVLFYTGNSAGSFNVLISNDGKKYTKLTDLSTSSAFSWEKKVIDSKTKYIKIVSNSFNTSLGDIQFFDTENNKIYFSSDDSSLTDELDLVPEKHSYLNSTYFDEIYFARSAYEYVHGINASEWTHPPLGKLIMAIPLLVLNFSPFTFRLMGNIAGILLIPVMYILAKRIFHNRKYAILSALLMMFDTFHFSHTRIALVDSFEILFILLSVIFMKNYLDLDKDSTLNKKTINLLLSGFFIGCSIAIKWNAIYAGIGLAIVFFIKLFKDKNKFKDLVILFFICLISFILIPLAIYILSYVLFPNVTNYDGTISGIITQTKNMYHFHSTLDATHPFSSKWYQWPIMYKPVWLYGEGFISTRTSIVDIGNPAIWWFGIIAFVYLVISSIKKNSNNIFILIFVLSTYLPYIFIGRVMFMYHYFITLPFIMLGIVSFIKYINEKTKSHKFCYLYIVIVIVLFILFYPVASGMPVKESYIDSLKWLSSWIF